MDSIIIFVLCMLGIFLLDILFSRIYPIFVGKAGEYHVKRELNKLSNKEYLVINDMLIKVNDITYQIDHVVVSMYGIFVIETKQYNGYIVGNEYDKKWKQNKYYINNPIYQNYGHIMELKELLDIDNDNFISIICIPSNVKMNVNSKTHVIHLYELNNVIHSYKDVKIKNYQEIFDKLLQLNILDKNERKKHISYAKKVKLENTINSINKCPKCGSDLVIRNGKNGKFIGCSNYPKCKYTKNI